MHLLGMKSVRPGLKACRVAAKTEAEDEAFIGQLSPLFPEMAFTGFTMRAQAAAVLPAALAATTMGVVGGLVAWWIDGNAALELCLVVPLGAIVYGAMLHAIDPRLSSQAIATARSLAARPRSA